MTYTDCWISLIAVLVLVALSESVAIGAVTCSVSSARVCSSADAMVETASNTIAILAESSNQDRCQTEGGARLTMYINDLGIERRVGRCR